jgi:hypothetical protein
MKQQSSAARRRKIRKRFKQKNWALFALTGFILLLAAKRQINNKDVRTNVAPSAGGDQGFPCAGPPRSPFQ